MASPYPLITGAPPGLISAGNASTTPLAAAATYTGAAEDTTPYSAIIVTVYAEPASADGTLFLEFSPDGAVWRRIKTIAVADPTVAEPQPLLPLAQEFFRVRYTNGATPQTIFELDVKYHAFANPELVSQIEQTLSSVTPVRNVRAVIVGKNPAGSYANVPLDAAGNLSVAYGDSPALDAFSRLRVSSPVSLFDSKTLRGTKETLFWDEALTGTGTSTVNTAESSVELAVTASGDAVVRQSKQRIIYQPGKSLIHVMTFVPPVADANVRWRAGYFDANDGIFLQGAGATISVVQRTSTSGAPSDAKTVNQVDWNIDGFGGGNPLNPSGITMDFDNKNVLMWIDLQWLSVGRVRIGFDLGGVLYPAHEFNTSNLTDVAYMKNPNLVFRYEITATGAPGATRTFDAICCSASSEGGHEPLGLTTPVSRARSALVIAAAYEELIAVRIQSGATDVMTAILDSFSILCTTAGNIHYVIAVNPVLTAAGAGTWLAASPQSSLEYNITRGGTWTNNRTNEDHRVTEGYFSNNVDGTTRDVDTTFTLGTDLSGTTDIYSLLAANVAGTNETVFGALMISEIF